MKKILTLLTFILCGTVLFGQGEIRLSEEMQSFALGSKNSIVVTIVNACLCIAIETSPSY